MIELNNEELEDFEEKKAEEILERILKEKKWDLLIKIQDYLNNEDEFNHMDIKKKRGSWLDDKKRSYWLDNKKKSFWLDN